MISVVMPCRNSQKYINRSIESILNQSFENFEFIILDDASTDATIDIIDSYKDNRIKLIREPIRRGNYYLRNKGIEISNGDYICTMDSDDISNYSRLLCQYNYLNKNQNVAVVGSNCIFIDEFENEIYRSKIPENSDILKVLMLKQNTLIHSTTLIRKKILTSRNINYNVSYTYAADYDLWFQILLNGTLAVLPEYLLSYRIHADQISNQFRKDQVFFSKKIRLRFLSKIGVHLSEYEQELYFRFLDDNGPTSPKEASTINFIVNNILDANNQQNTFNSEFLIFFFNSLRERINSI